MPRAPTHNVKIVSCNLFNKSYFMQNYDSYSDSKKRTEFQIINL